MRSGEWRDPAWTGSIGDFPVKSSQHLGGGGDGTVYLATVTFQGGKAADYAIKVNNQAGPDPIFGEDAIKLGGKEIPGAVIPHGPYDVNIKGEDQPSMAVLMPRIAGSNLEQKVGSEGPLSKRETVSMMAQVARTLHHAHEQGFVHMDVKPSNVMHEQKSGRYLTIDWGEVHDQGQVLKEDIGTLAYQAPEQWSKAKADGKMDIYSLALTAAQAHTGDQHRRFKAYEGPLAVKEHIQNEKEGHPTVKDAHLNAVLKRMSMKNPDERASSLDVMTDLAAYKEARQAYDPIDREKVAKHLVTRSSNVQTRHVLLDAAAAQGLLRDLAADHPRRKALEAIGSLAPDISGLDQEMEREQQRQAQQQRRDDPTPRPQGPRR